jgi:hypothetical protein
VGRGRSAVGRSVSHHQVRDGITGNKIHHSADMVSDAVNSMKVYPANFKLDGRPPSRQLLREQVGRP